MGGLIELGVVFGFVIAWAVVELVALRMDKRRAEREKAEQQRRAAAGLSPPDAD